MTASTERDERDHAERARDEGDAGRAIRDQLLHRLQLDDRLIGIGGGDGAAQVAGDARRIADRAHDEGMRERRVLRQRPIDGGCAALLEPVVQRRRRRRRRP